MSEGRRRQLRILALITGVFSVLRLLTCVPGIGLLLPPFLRSPGLSSTALADGSAVSAWDVFRIVRCYNANMLTWSWRPGQFVVLDNHRFGHFRTPFDPGYKREVYTMFGSRRES